MDIRQLRYFASIAEYGSLSAAAEQLRVAQPSLSQHVKRMEDELGVQLLVRSPRGVILTDSGRLFYDHCKKIIGYMEIAIAEMRAHSSDISGPVTLGFPSSAANVLLVPLVETIRHQYPQVVLRVMEGMSGHVQQWLSEGMIDLGILYDVNSARNLTLFPLVMEKLFLVCAPDDWDSPVGTDGIAEQGINLADCAGFDLILPNRTHGLRELIERVAEPLGIMLSIFLEADSLSQIKMLVARGSGRTILPIAAVTQEVEAGRLVLVPIQNPPIQRMVYLAKNSEVAISRAAVEVERTCVNVVEELVTKKRWGDRPERHRASIAPA